MQATENRYGLFFCKLDFTTAFHFTVFFMNFKNLYFNKTVLDKHIFFGKKKCKNGIMKSIALLQLNIILFVYVHIKE